MRRLLVIAISALIRCALAFAGFFLWAHHTYTVGMDLNVKALAVAGAALVLIAGVILAVAFVVRRRGGKVR